MFKDNEVKGIGNSLDFGARWMDTRTARLGMTRDPLYQKFPWQSPYAFAGNSPIMYIDREGKEIMLSYYEFNAKGKPEIKIAAIYRDGKLFTRDGKEFATDNVFINSSKQTLDKLNNIDSRVGQVVKDLQGSDKTHVIGNWDHSYDSKNISTGEVIQSRPELTETYNRTNSGFGSITRFHPDETRKRTNDPNASDAVLLGHELKHAWNREQGYFQESPKDVIPSNSEVDAVNFENIIREKEGAPLKTSHGSEISKDRLISPSEYQIKPTEK